MWSYRLNTNSKCTDITMVGDGIDFKTYTVIQVIHKHDNHCCVFWKVKMYKHGTWLYRLKIYTQSIDRKMQNTYHNIDNLWVTLSY